jgi:hypothetical protein
MNMINLKKLAMISAMGMVLSTSAMADDVDGKENVSLTVAKADIAFDADNSSVNVGNQVIHRGTLLDEDLVSIVIKFTGEGSETITSTYPDHVVLASADDAGHTFDLKLEKDTTPTQFTDGVVSFELSSKAGVQGGDNEISSTADFAAYSADYTVSIDY